MTPALKTSMYMAVVGGTLTPILETIRRWSQLTDPAYFMNWFDDYIIGTFLLFAAFKTYRSVANGQRFLIGAWAFATGMALSSLVSQLQNITSPDPAPVSSITVGVIKAFMLLICIVCLTLSLRTAKQNQDR
jgi:hypothetical protein